MSVLTKNWLSVINTFGALYEVVFQSVYSRTGKSKLTPQASKQYVTKFLESFPRIASFTQLILFDEGGNEDHYLCNKLARTMKSRSSLDN